ncbi:cold shock domain-containing protein [Undibacterium luofuense]|uniref:cold shock domain-containing protein n=1 Tax=Undibacterium luofuense TaxID=2828733 RepID=UPI0030EB7329
MLCYFFGFFHFETFFFGFIQQQGGPDMYFSVQNLETQDLQAGAEVRFEIISTQRGSEARKIRALNEQS